MRIPGTQDGLLKVAKDSWERLSVMDPQDIARRAKAELSEGSVKFIFIGGQCEARLGERLVLLDGRELNAFKSLVVVHYLIGARDSPPSGKLVSFRELWGGDVYYDAFAARAIRPIAEVFGPSPAALVGAGRPLGARILEMGAASIEFPALPRLPLTFVVWKGDEEVPDSANVLFDSTANEHLPTEDLVALSSLAAGRLIGTSRGGR